MTELKRIIIQGATELFAKKGCKAITMDDIAKSLGMSKRTIYENFKDKEELLGCCVNFLFEEMDKEFDTWNKSDNIILSFLVYRDSANSVMQQVPKDFFADVRRYFPKLSAQIIDTRVEQDKERTIYLLEKGKKEGYFLPELNSQVIAILIQEVGRVMCDEDLFSKKQFKDNDIFFNGFIPYLRGISTQKGIETVDRYYHLQKSTK